MRVIVCDICGDELGNNDVYTALSFMNNESAMDLCKKCHDIYNIMERSYLEEQHEIFEKRQKDIIDLREKYKKETLKLKENS